MQKIVGFLKVAKTEYIEDLVLRGKLYFSLAESFRDKKRYGAEKVDPFEGSLSKYERLMIDIGTEENPHYVNVASPENIAVTGNECIYCIRSLYEKDVDYVPPTQFNIHLDPGFIPGIIGDDDWANYSFLWIMDPICFINTVEAAVKQLGLPYSFSPVNYDDHYYENTHSLFSDFHAIESYGHKNKYPYCKQQEYRFLVQNTEHKDMMIDIGSNFFKPGNFIWGKDLSILCSSS